MIHTKKWKSVTNTWMGWVKINWIKFFFKKKYSEFVAIATMRLNWSAKRIQLDIEQRFTEYVHALPVVIQQAI